jgi:hypothetical protein
MVTSMIPAQAIAAAGADYQIEPIWGRWQVVGYKVCDQWDNEIARYDMKGRQVVSPDDIQAKS